MILPCIHVLCLRNDCVGPSTKVDCFFNLCLKFKLVDSLQLIEQGKNDHDPVINSCIKTYHISTCPLASLLLPAKNTAGPREGWQMWVADHLVESHLEQPAPSWRQPIPRDVGESIKSCCSKSLRSLWVAYHLIKLTDTFCYRLWTVDVKLNWNNCRFMSSEKYICTSKANQGQFRPTQFTQRCSEPIESALPFLKEFLC